MMSNFAYILPPHLRLRSRRWTLHSSVGFSVLALASCAPQIDLAKTPPVLSTGWQAPPGNAGGANTVANQGWAAFGSPELEALIARAQRRNPDIGIALARITQARGDLGVSRSVLLPTIGARVGGQSDRSDLLQSRSVSANDIFGGIDIGYELDLFGENRSARNADRARLLATGFDAESTQLLVETTVARFYFQYLTLIRREAIVDRALNNARELERIIQIRFEEGVATRVDLGLQSIEVRNLQADKSRLIQARIATRNALAVLVGEEAPLFRLGAGNLSALAVPDIESQLPGALLVRRPDIKAAEARIAASRGDVKAARAAFLPSLSVSAGGLASAASFANPITLGLNAGGELLATIFSGGRLRSDLTRAGGLQREAVESYRSVLLTALAEAEDALTGIDQSSRRLSLLGNIVEDAQLTAELAREQYISGVADTRTALEAERELLAAEENYAIARQESLDAVVDLYRAMGGNPGREADEALTGETRLDYRVVAFPRD